jgi:hypothetical protein
VQKAGLNVDMGIQTISKSSGDDNALAAELDYLWKEATDRGNITEMKKQTTVKGAVDTWLAVFEIAGIPNTSEREKAGSDAMTRYGSNGSNGGGVSTDSNACGTDDSGNLVGDYSLPIPKSFYQHDPSIFSHPHHLHSDGSPDIAVDISVPSGTKVFSVTAGKIITAPNGQGYGNGVTIDAGHGITFIYGHGSDGGTIDGAHNGDTVKAGQLIMHSDNTGFSTGPHLHITIKINGVDYCPQTFLKGIAQGRPPDIKSLPTSGCSGGSKI